MKIKLKNNLKNKNAFTLIELMVAVTIIAIMASIAIYGLPAVQKKGQDTQRLAGLRELQLAIEGYKGINGRYPDAGADAVNYVSGLTPGFIAKLPKDTSQTSANGFKYAVSSDKKSYCIAIKNTVFKNSSQADLIWGSNSWKTCRGNTDMTSSL